MFRWDGETGAAASRLGVTRDNEALQMPTVGHDNYATTKLILGLVAGALATALIKSRIVAAAHSNTDSLNGLWCWVVVSIVAGVGYLLTAPKARHHAPAVIGFMLGVVSGWCICTVVPVDGNHGAPG